MKKALLIGSALTFGIIPWASALPPPGYAALDSVETAVLGATVYRYAVKPGSSFRTTLETWSKKAGWKPVVWQIPAKTDFTLGAGGGFDGNIVEASRSLVRAMGPQAALRIEFNPAQRELIVMPRAGGVSGL